MEIEECQQLISKFMESKDINDAIHDMVNKNEKRLIVSLDKLREYNSGLYNELIKKPGMIQNIFEEYINDHIDSDEVYQKQKLKTSKLKTKLDKFKVSFNGNFGKNMVSPRGLNASLANQLVCIQGIVTRSSIVRPKLCVSKHYCEETKQGTVKEYFDQYTSGGSMADSLMQKNKNSVGGVNNVAGNLNMFVNNSVPMKDMHGNPLSFEYGLSEFRDFQVILIQEPPEKTPLGQLPRSIEIILQDDLVDKVKPGDRIQIVGIFKCIASSSTSFTGNFKTVLIASSIHSLSAEINVPKVSGDDIREIKKISEKEDFLELLASSLAPSIYGSDFIKRALVLQLLGGLEKNLDNGTHLRGDINIMLIGDPSTAKSQFLRYILSIAPNAIATTGRGSTGVGLTAAVVVDKDTGERHLEAGAMVLGDRGVVCIDEFDKMNELDRVAIHEVMEQQTVTIAKAGIHVSLNARCSVLSAANPIYGEYQKDMSASKNIGLPDSLLSRFDLVFIVLDEDDPELDRKIADRVIKNHQFPSETASLFTGYDDKIIEPDLNMDDTDETQVYEKHSKYSTNKKKQVLTKNFFKKYIFYAKTKSEPALTNEAKDYITTAWTELRANKGEFGINNFQAVPITVRTLETLIRLSTAHAKARLSKVVLKKDCIFAEGLLKYTLLGESVYDENNLLDDKQNMNNIDKVNHRNNISQQDVIYEDHESDEENNYNSRYNNSNTKRKSNSKVQSKSIRKNSKDKKDNYEKPENIVDAHTTIHNLSNTYSNFVFQKLVKMKKPSNDYLSVESIWTEVQNSSNNRDNVSVSNETHLRKLLKKLENDGNIQYIEDNDSYILID
jgi:DNA replication licensing factor MCM3